MVPPANLRLESALPRASDVVGESEDGKAGKEGEKNSRIHEGRSQVRPEKRFFGRTWRTGGGAR
jgi:hypothetical protein